MTLVTLVAKFSCSGNGNRTRDGNMCAVSDTFEYYYISNEAERHDDGRL
jgi:hypothetical protein